MWRHRAQQRSTPVKCEAVIAGLASEGLALILGSAEARSSAVVGPTPTCGIFLIPQGHDFFSLWDL